MISKAIIKGCVGAGALLAVYFAFVSFISSWSFALSQFSSFWYFIIGLSFGFGIQIGLYTYLRGLLKGRGDGTRVLGVTGTTSTIAMISCCTHYLANLLPILGVVGIVTFVAQYQIELFWVGLVFNLGGVAYMAHKIYQFQKA